MGEMDSSTRRRMILAGIAGNVLEWYDFAVYGYFAPIIGRHFFPAEDPTTSLIASLGVFAAGFLMRPVGGVVFGHIGDRIGRKAALTLSVLAMAIPTFLIGLLPGHAQWGVTASVLLVLLRMIQGLSVGGEYTTSVVFLVEGAPDHARGWTGSWSVFGAGAGTLLGSAVGALVNTVLSPDQTFAWGWRLPFLVGLVVGLAGLYVRRHIPEPRGVPETAPEGLPILDAFRTEWRAILQIAGLNLLNAVGFYLMFVYSVTYLRMVVHVRAAEALDINTINMMVFLTIIPLAGALSDRVGRKPLLTLGALGVLLFAWPCFWLMHHPSFTLILLGQMGFAFFAGLYFGAIPVTMVEALPTRVRCSALSVGYNVCLAVFGGLTPMIAAYLIERSHEDLSPAFYLMAAAACSLAAILTLPETSKMALR